MIFQQKSNIQVVFDTSKKIGCGGIKNLFFEVNSNNVAGNWVLHHYEGVPLCYFKMDNERKYKKFYQIN